MSTWAWLDNGKSFCMKNYSESYTAALADFVKQVESMGV